ncbi:MAG: Asp-tRNA(Asn)/Glu-tRNA(Gln) amidotransferase subunit GatC [Planctomycetota bacterium]|nr:Asp-tRNA(Asn)/Glu-tRNA(Gln) amidotransferase subunit GatC [Planctomycetota bacterium]
MGTELDRDQVRSLAELARLDPSPADEGRILTHLRRILEYVSKLEELDTSSAPPSHSVLRPIQHFRKDGTEKSLPGGDSVAPAPDREGHFFRVPRVLD